MVTAQGRRGCTFLDQLAYGPCVLGAVRARVGSRACCAAAAAVLKLGLTMDKVRTGQGWRETFEGYDRGRTDDALEHYALTQLQ